MQNRKISTSPDNFIESFIIVDRFIGRFIKFFFSLPLHSTSMCACVYRCRCASCVRAYWFCFCRSPVIQRKIIWRPGEQNWFAFYLLLLFVAVIPCVVEYALVCIERNPVLRTQFYYYVCLSAARYVQGKRVCDASWRWADALLQKHNGWRAEYKRKIARKLSVAQRWISTQTNGSANDSLVRTN